MPPPEFFDIFGLAVFGFIAAVSFRGLKTGNALPRRVLKLLLAIGIAGLLVDGWNVFSSYF